MNLDRKRAAFRILRELLDLPEQARDAHLAARCGDDAALAAQVRTLLAAQPSPVMDEPASTVAHRLAGHGDDALVGTELGGWRVLAALGSGGMGSVYRVQRDGDGYVQQGALKLIKRGMDSAELIARFRRERGILARLAHPHIAGLLDGGVSEDGRPFLVMDYIDGLPLLDWADHACADLDHRLLLFLQICDAVAHAHRQLVVHRDIKPGNILVDADGHARLLDFGIARMLEGDDDNRTVAASRFASPAYAAPEQRRDGAITTATDIYQLGVVLFELLSGTRHVDYIDTGAARAAMRLALARDQAGDRGPAAIAAQQLRGDLGIIVSRASDPDPERRYGTVAALADDLRRFRSGQPILARADSALYRMHRFVARHRWPVALTSLAVAGLIVTTVLAVNQANRADREARLARAAQDFLVRVFDASAPDSATGAQISARQLLDQGVALIGQELGDQPRLRNQMLVTMGRLYRQLGQYQAATDLLRQTRTTADDSARDRALAALELATAERLRESLDEAGQALADAFALDVPDADVQAALLLERSHLHEIQGRYDDALADARAATAINARRGSEGRIDWLQSRHAEALVLNRQGQSEAALAVFDDAIGQANSALDANDTRLGQLHNDHAGALLHAGRAADAETAARTALAIARSRLGEQHPAIGQGLQILGGALRQQGKLAEAEQALASALAIQRKALGETHGDIANSLNSLAILALTRQDDLAAENYLRQALAILAALGQAQTTQAVTMTSNLGTALMRQGRYDEAEPLLRQALEHHRATVGERHPAVFNSLHSLGQLAMRQERPAQAADYARSAVELAQAIYGDSRELAIARTSLASALLETGALDQAQSLASLAEQQLAETGSDDARRLHALLIQARVHARRGEHEIAREQAAEIARIAHSPSAEKLFAHQLLAGIAQARNERVEAQRQRDQVAAELSRLPTADPHLRRQLARH